MRVRTAVFAAVAAGVAPNATMQVDLGRDAWTGPHKRPVGAISTDDDGNGTAQITVPAAVLLATCGAGNHAGQSTSTTGAA